MDDIRSVCNSIIAFDGGDVVDRQTLVDIHLVLSGQLRRLLQSRCPRLLLGHSIDVFHSILLKIDDPLALGQTIQNLSLVNKQLRYIYHLSASPA